MMSKYQLVFVKIENAFHKIINSRQIRDREGQFEAFLAIKRHAAERQVRV